MNVMDDLAKIQNKNFGKNGVINTSKTPPFVMAYNTFLMNEHYSGQQKMLFIILEGYAGTDVDCYPSKASVSKKMCISIKTVERLLKQLEELGAILIINRQKESNRKTSNLYILADINLNTGEFIPSSLDIYRPLKEKVMKVQGK